MFTIYGVSPKNRVKNKKLLVLITSMVLIVVLFSSLFVIYKLTLTDVDCGVGGGVWDVSLVGAVFVGSEGELVRAVDGAGLDGVSMVVVLTRDVFLSGSLVVGEGKNVTLTSNNSSGGGFFGLFGADGERVVVVEGGGWLCVDGIVISHEEGVVGGGVDVGVGGEFVLVRGKISNNVVADLRGGGVRNMGVFRMFGGEISGNKADDHGSSWYHGLTVWYEYGGGVWNGGVFELFGGLIDSNAGYFGGGVFNSGNFSMFGGSITKNTADKCGGVSNSGNFSMFGGSITKNTADKYGGVGSTSGGDTMFEGGKIVNNKSKSGKGNNIHVVDKDGNVVLIR